MPYIEDSLKKFYKLPLEIVYTVDSEEVERKVHEINKKYNVDLFALVIFVTVGDVERERSFKYIMVEFGKSEIEARNIFIEINKVFKYIEKRLKFLDINPSKTSISQDEEKDIILNIFNKKLLRELSHNPVIIYSVNLRIFNILKNEVKFKEELEKNIYNNSELLSNKKIILKNTKHNPTISNWIKCFVVERGSKMFNSMDFSEFIVNSNNVKGLNDREKNLLLRVLKTYNNIKFFPNSMYSDNVDDWEVLPIKKNDFEESYEDLGKGSQIRDVKNKGIEKDNKHIAELEKIKKEYKKGSIEYKAVEEEIKKVKKTTKNKKK